MLSLLVVALAGLWWIHAGTPVVAGVLGAIVGAGAVAVRRSAPDAIPDLLVFLQASAAAPGGATRQGLEALRAAVGAAVAAWLEVTADGSPKCVELVGTPFAGWRDEVAQFAGEVPVGSDALHVRTLPMGAAATVRTAAGVAVVSAGRPGVLVVSWYGVVTSAPRLQRFLLAAAAHLAVVATADGRAAAAEARGARRERARLARELHDGPAQVLAYLKFKSEAALAPGPDGRPQAERMERALAAVRQEAGGAIDDLRATIAGLRTDESLVPRLEAVVEGFRRQTGIACALLLPNGPPPVGGEVAGHVLGIVQEALANVRKHARAHHAWVRLAYGPRGLLAASVADDGQGFDASTGTASRHFGLEILRERATALGGTVTIRPRRGGGTEVLLEWPGGKRVTAS